MRLRDGTVWLGWIPILLFLVLCVGVTILRCQQFHHAIRISTRPHTGSLAVGRIPIYLTEHPCLARGVWEPIVIGHRGGYHNPDIPSVELVSINSMEIRFHVIFIANWNKEISYFRPFSFEYMIRHHNGTIRCGVVDFVYQPMQNNSCRPSGDMPTIDNRNLNHLMRKVVLRRPQNQIGPFGNMQSVFGGISGTGSSIGRDLRLRCNNLRLVSLIFHSVGEVFGSVSLIFHVSGKVFRPISLISSGSCKIMGVGSTLTHFPPLTTDKDSRKSRQNYGSFGPPQSGFFKTGHLLFNHCELLCIGCICCLGIVLIDSIG